jgi:hypothetical protein
MGVTSRLLQLHFQTGRSGKAAKTGLDIVRGRFHDSLQFTTRIRMNTEERHMRKTIIGTGLAVLVILALGVTGLAEGKKVTLTGHLIDQMCGGAMKDVAKAAEHTKECSLMDHCASSGYGIFADGKYVKFDAEGSKKAKALIEKSSKEKGLEIVAEGTQDGDTLTVASLKEK